MSQNETSVQQNNKDENKVADKPEWETEKTTESRNETHLNETSTSFLLEDLFQLLSSQSKNSLVVISLGDSSPFLGIINDGMNS